MQQPLYGYRDESLHQLILRHHDSSDDQLEQVEDFERRFVSEPGYALIEHSVKYLKAEALENLGRDEEALAIFGELYNAEAYTAKSLAAQLSATLLLRLQRDKEAFELIDKDLSSDRHFIEKLHSLGWLNKHHPDVNGLADRYNQVLSTVVSGLEIDIPRDLTAFSDIVSFLEATNRKSNRAYGNLVLADSKEDINSRIAMCEQYIEHEPIGYYRKMAEERLSALQNQ